MRRFLMLTAMAVTTLAGQAAMANDRPEGPPPECRQHDRKCPEQPKRQKPGHDRGKGDRPAAEARRDAQHPPGPAARRDDRRESPARKIARVGDSARDARPFRPGRDSRVAPAPRGQEYRVIGDRLVLVDPSSQRILSVVGRLAGDR